MAATGAGSAGKRKRERWFRASSRIDRRGLIAEPGQQPCQVRRHPGRAVIHADAEPLADFRAEGHAVGPADPGVTWLRIVGHLNFQTWLLRVNLESRRRETAG